MEESKADLVYISLINSQHFFWAKKALEKNYHVIVDKPITCKLQETFQLLKMAKKRKRLLAEATFFDFHKQFTTSINYLGGSKKINFINTNFIIPKPKNNNFRMKKKFNGGCVADMSPYAAATARILGLGKCLNFNSIIFRNKSGLETSFTISCRFKKNYYFGYFRFGGEYKNNMILTTDNKHIELNNVFSPPSDKNLTLIIKK